VIDTHTIKSRTSKEAKILGAIQRKKLDSAAMIK